PSKEEMEKLYVLAMMGNMRDIRERATYLTELDVCYVPFADKLRSMAEEFQSEAIVAMIETYTDTNSAP
ncbi:MAG TPA: hypothetical protein VM532_14935, partial [Burkholderiales bacterium]|nr:hypothetical protein [Burkholderiales bacterium]